MLRISSSRDPRPRRTIFFYGKPPAGVAVGETEVLGLIPLVLCAAILVVLGLTVPGPVGALLAQGRS
jgi:hypothetical protein